MEKAKKIAVDYLYIAIGSFILAFGINYFLVPMKISTGGVSGIGTVLYYFFSIPLSFMMRSFLSLIKGYELIKSSAADISGSARDIVSRLKSSAPSPSNFFLMSFT